MSGNDVVDWIKYLLPIGGSVLGLYIGLVIAPLQEKMTEVRAKTEILFLAKNAHEAREAGREREESKHAADHAAIVASVAKIDPLQNEVARLRREFEHEKMECDSIRQDVEFLKKNMEKRK